MVFYISLEGLTKNRNWRSLTKILKYEDISYIEKSQNLIQFSMHTKSGTLWSKSMVYINFQKRVSLAYFDFISLTESVTFS